MMVTGNDKDIGYRQWIHPAPRAVFLLVHGLGTHSGRWEATAEFFLKHGISSYAIELHDYDQSGKLCEASDNFKSFYRKILRLSEIVAGANPGKKIFLIGESLGALISFLVCTDRPGLFDGLVCISPAFVTRHKLTFTETLRMLAPLLYDPKKRSKLPFDSSMCTRDAAYRARLDNDPREYRTASAKLIFEILMAQARARVVNKKLTTPALFLVAGDDKIVDPKAARAVFGGLSVKDKSLVEFPGMYHALSIELGKEKVFEVLLVWVNGRV